MAWHNENEIENLVENIRSNNISKNTECKSNFEVEKVGQKHSVNWNHTDLIINWNKKYSNPIHVDPNHTD